MSGFVGFILAIISGVLKYLMTTFHLNSLHSPELWTLFWGSKSSDLKGSITDVVCVRLVKIRKALKGQIAMSSELKSIFNSMLVGKVPAMWAAKSYTSFNHLMGSYVTDLLARLQFLQVRFMIVVSHLDHDHLWNMTAKISVAHTKELKVSSILCAAC